MIALPVIIVLLVMFYASYSIKSNIYLKTFCQKSTSDKVVALTFDDGPDALQTPKVLDVLKEYNVQACFFCVGSRIDKNESIISRMVNEGHLIGNHSYSHTNLFPLYHPKKMKTDLMLCQQKLEEITKQKNILFRPPFGVTNPTIGRTARQMNLEAIGWSIRSLDTQLSLDKALKRIQRKLHPGAIILLHDVLPQSELLLREVIDLLLREGYQIKRLDLM